MKAKEARKIIKKIAKGDHYVMRISLTEFSSGVVTLVHSCYIRSIGWISNYDTWEEVIEELRHSLPDIHVEE